MSTNIDINKFKRLSRFTPLVWRDNVTKLNASNMNTISSHLQALNDALSDGNIASAITEIQNSTLVFKDSDNTVGYTYNPSAGAPKVLTLSSLALNGNTYNPLASAKTQLYIPKLNVTQGNTTTEYNLIGTSETGAIDITIPENTPTFSLKTNSVTTDYVAGTDNSTIKLKAIEFGGTTSSLLSETGEDSLSIALQPLTINGTTYDGTTSVSINVSGGGGEGGTITIDGELSSESTNAVQNKVITEALSSKVDSGNAEGVVYYNGSLQPRLINNVNDIFNYTVGKKCYNTTGTTLRGEMFNSAKPALGINSHTEGYACGTDAAAENSHAQGYQTRTHGVASFTSGHSSFAVGNYSSCIGKGTTLPLNLEDVDTNIVSYYLNNKAHISRGTSSFNTGEDNITWGNRSFTMGQGNIAVSDDCLVHGRFSYPEASIDSDTNTISQNKKYLHIVGNGTKTGTEISRSNAYTLDEHGNGVFSGTVSYTDSITDPTTPTQKTLTSSITLQIEYLDSPSQDIEIPVISITQEV